MNSYDKLKFRIAELERDKAEMRTDIFALLYGDDSHIEKVVSKWNRSFNPESSVELPRDIVFIQPLERE